MILRRRRTKRAVVVLALAVGLATCGALLSAATNALVRASTGAEPGDAFSETAVVPASLAGRVEWTDDREVVHRELESATLEAIEGAWVRAYGDLELASAGTKDVALDVWFSGRALATAEGFGGDAVPMWATEHRLRIEFYSADGQIMALTATVAVVRDIGGRHYEFEETYDSVVVLSDGNWRIEQLVRTASMAGEDLSKP